MSSLMFAGSRRPGAPTSAQAEQRADNAKRSIRHALRGVKVIRRRPSRKARPDDRGTPKFPMPAARQTSDERVSIISGHLAERSQIISFLSTVAGVPYLTAYRPDIADHVGSGPVTSLGMPPPLYAFHCAPRCLGSRKARIVLHPHGAQDRLSRWRPSLMCPQ